MGNERTSYIYYLKEPIKSRAIERIYNRIEEFHPTFKFSHNKEDCISFTNDYIEYAANKPLFDHYCWIEFKDLLKIFLINHDLPNDQEGDMALDPVLGIGERQFEVLWYHLKFRDFWAFPDDKWDDLSEFFQILSDIVEIINPFFGIFGREDNFDSDYDDDIEDYQSTFEYYRMMLSEVPHRWNSIFVDDSLFREIGIDNINEWSEMIIPISDVGYFIEREEKNLGGSFPPSSDYLHMKGELFLNHFYPPIIRRLKSEFPY